MKRNYPMVIINFLTLVEEESKRSSAAFPPGNLKRKEGIVNEETYLPQVMYDALNKARKIKFSHKVGLTANAELTRTKGDWQEFTLQ